MSESDRKHTFGPVPSRRLGRSLGVDLVPFKTCPYDCIYCQLGSTTTKTVERCPYFPVEAVIADVKEALDKGVEADYITLSGSGEPTLHSEIGCVIGEVKKLTDIPVVVLTNGGLLADPDVRRALSKADIVAPDLDAGSEAMFSYINRPHSSILLNNVVDGLAKFREKYSGRIWLEVFLLAGVNTAEAEIEKIKSHIERINPDEIHLNTVARPTAEDYAWRVPDDIMLRMRDSFGDKAKIVSPFKHEELSTSQAVKKDDVLALLARRPCTLEDIASGLSIHHNEAGKYVAALLSEGRIAETRQNGVPYYFAAVDNRDVKGT